MKNLIGLYGTGNVGKSETIRIVYNKLIEMYPGFILHKDFVQIIPTKGDICAVIIINGKIIGIESQGDPKSRIFKSIPIFVELNCDIILCATRTRGETVHLVEKLKNTHEIKWIHKTGSIDSSKHRANDEKTASEILKIITVIIQ